MNQSKKALRHSLWASAIAILLCGALLFATTFAWFTDSKTSGVNKIEAGTLKIELKQKNSAGEWVDAEGQTLNWKKAEGYESQSTLWEPGCRYVLPELRITNKGNLALQFKVLINSISGDKKLLDALDFSVSYFNEDPNVEPVIMPVEINQNTSLPAELPNPMADDPYYQDYIREFGWTGILLDTSEYAASNFGTDYVCLQISAKMKESAGNEYQNLKLEDIAITVVATQAAGPEWDSFNNTYDKNAEYPDVLTVTDHTSLTNAVTALSSSTAKSTTLTLPKATADSPIETNISIPAGKDVTITGATENPADTVIDGQVAALSNGTLIIKNCTINVDSVINDSTNISQTGASGIAVWGNQDVICENVVFNMSLANSTAITAWWSTGDGANITVRNCVFNCNGQRPIRSDASVTVENCTFNDPYRYAVQMTSKANTISAEGNAVVNFKNNTINAGTTSDKPVYGIQLEGETYGCSNLTINGSSNTINLGSTGKTGTMYVYEGTTNIHDITWNVTDGEPTNIG